MSDSDAKFNAERNAAFENDDLSWIRNMFPDIASLKVVEMAFHKSRLECAEVSEIKRRESAKWLAERGLNRINGLPVSADMPLPKGPIR